jgi:hypothetical protein
MPCPVRCEYCLILKTKTLRSFYPSVTVYQSTQRDIPEDSNPQRNSRLYSITRLKYKTNSKASWFFVCASTLVQSDFIRNFRNYQNRPCEVKDSAVFTVSTKRNGGVWEL